ncbi:MAG: DUF4347 domain-containing protein [Pseudomonadota bacterium]
MFDTTPAPRQENAFINGNLADFQTLIAGMRPGIDVVVLDPAGDGLAQIARALAGHTGLDAIHLVGHGAAGLLQLGEVTLDADYLKANAGVLADIGAALAAGGDILVYGCETGAGNTGVGFLQALADTTGADIAASDDASGGARAGGDWQLEARLGQVDAASALAGGADAYSATLALGSGSVHTYSENTWAWSSLAQDAAGNIYLAHKLSSSAIALKQWNGAGWTALTTLTTAMTGDTNFSDDLSLKIGADGNPTLLYTGEKVITTGLESLRGIKAGHYDLATH